MERFPDIEIYLAPIDKDAILAWLNETFSQTRDWQPSGKGKWRTLFTMAEGELPVLLIENAADRFSSLWLDSSATPWPRDVDCARAAQAALGVEVRCSLGGWQPGDEPDRFYRVKAGGEEEVFHWPDSGL
ncbi:hypothetical protein [Larsenimonas suaedae]|uniref:Uncharacterized protein n=1 Tax=Larsenimonas suaedae TaxID=1851019 RepID=A0ABU1GTI1_9GAMM|nr:hypothetical protein [Larsenimonas suaedae]MCM2972328.1 hypothetical protein [Larsenimonas suaedae]MDR5894876.1 hypothetical protein [Larsenimonas suaedae]